MRTVLMCFKNTVSSTRQVCSPSSLFISWHMAISDQSENTFSDSLLGPGTVPTLGDSAVDRQSPSLTGAYVLKVSSTWLLRMDGYRSE